MTHTHPDITHPALRHRMASALNTLRKAAIMRMAAREWRDDLNLYALRAMVRRAVNEMALLEQALDDAQADRIIADYCAAHPVAEWWR